MFSLLLPSLCLRIYQKSALGFIQDLFFISLFSLLPRIFWIPFCLMHAAIWFLTYRLGIPLHKSLCSYLRHPSSFYDSARFLKLPQFFLAILLLSLPGLFAAPLPPYFLASGLVFLRRKKKKEGKPAVLHFPFERADFLSPRYPLLRKTRAFLGKKRFSQTGKNVVFIFLESFRAKNIGCLGAQTQTSPAFDALAKEGVLYRRFLASGLQTSRALLSSLFGIQPHLNTMNLKSYSSIPLIGLPQILKERGYQTALMQGGTTTFDWSYPFFKAHGFDTIIGKEELANDAKWITSWGVSDADLYAYARAWKPEHPFFLTLFTISNHHPWEAPPDWDFPTDQRFLKTFSYADHQLGLFLKQRWEDTLYFLIGDHGQSMGEHGQPIATHNDLYQENLHVPLLILGPGIKPMAIDTPSSQVDLMPTVLDLLGIEAIHHGVGKSLAREISAPIYFSLPGQQMGQLKNSTKLIEDKCYDLDKDPDEQNPQEASLENVEETASYFRAIDSLFMHNNWAPPQKIAFELSASTEEEWRTLSSQSAPVIDLSKGQFTDRHVFDINPTLLHELNLSHTLITDRSLDWIKDHCHHLKILHLSSCPLISAEAIGRVIQHCHQLCEIHLENLSELPEIHEARLTALRLKGSPFKSAPPHLVFLSATLDKEALIALPQTELQYLDLEGGDGVDDEAFRALCQKNPDLALLAIDSFPLLTKLPHIPALQRLKIACCPKLKDLSLLTAQEYEILDCPGITAQQLAQLPPCKILYNGHLELSDVQTLASLGVELF